MSRSKQYVMNAFGKRVRYYLIIKGEKREFTGIVIGWEPRPRGKLDGNWFVIRPDDDFKEADGYLTTHHTEEAEIIG